jgi:hypothetical protein
MRTIYAVTQGTYSDYRVRVLFNNRDDAHRHIKSLQADDDPYLHTEELDIEEFTLMDPGEQPERVPHHYVQIIVGPHGGIQKEHHSFGMTWTAGDYDSPPGKRPRVEVGQAPAFGQGWYIRVVARTEEAAWKAARDRAAQKRAELLELSR